MHEYTHISINTRTQIWTVASCCTVPLHSHTHLCAQRCFSCVYLSGPGVTAPGCLLLS
uniref:Uncharacterized protein n=1 Tax=Anguilla anguilla TaxID=7936 RepID=A0A0E9U090_ANGAN